MVGSYLTSGVRAMWRQRGYVLINLAGLSLGIAFSLILFFHLKIELGFDKSIPDRDRVYRIVRTELGAPVSAELSPLLPEQLENQFADIDITMRMSPIEPNVMYLPGKETRTAHRVGRGYFADSTFFEMFGVLPLHGDVTHSLSDPSSIVLTESLSQKLFGTTHTVGKTIETMNGNIHKVSAVIPDPPYDSHFQYEYIRPMIVLESFLRENWPDLWNSRTWAGMLIYLKLQPSASIQSIRERMPDFLQQFYPAEMDAEEIASIEYTFQPITDIHLKPGFSDDIGPRTNPVYLKVFGVVGVLILLIACVNFINISLALGLKRTREVGIRRAIGADGRQVGVQFFLENGIQILAAGLLSLLVVNLVFPFYVRLSGYPLQASELWSLSNLPMVAGVLILVFLSGGLYPVLQAVRLRPVQGLRDGRNPGTAIGNLRKGLLLFQFFISAATIFCTSVIYLQSIYLARSDPGFESAQVAVFTPYGELRQEVYGDLDAFKQRLLRDPGLLSVSFASALPGIHYSGEAMYTEETPPDSWPGVSVLRADPDIVETLGLELAAGRSFQGLDINTPAFLPNEAAVMKLGLTDPVGKPAWNNLWGPFEGTITGVLRDFNYESLYESIGPLVIENRPDATRYILVRFAPGHVREGALWVETCLEEMAPGKLYDREFLDSRIEQLYLSEAKLSIMFRTFGLLGILISSLGLLGMTALTVQNKKREIGIRKVLGASVSSIHGLISRRYLRGVVLANLIALPVGAVLMNRWLTNFAYHITIPWLLYPATLLLSFVVAYGVMSGITLGAARSDPLVVLRRESS